MSGTLPEKDWKYLRSPGVMTEQGESLESRAVNSDS
jgi:hypothetical protein